MRFKLMLKVTNYICHVSYHRFVTPLKMNVFVKGSANVSDEVHSLCTNLMILVKTDS